MKFLRKFKPSRLVGTPRRDRHRAATHGALVRRETVIERAPFDGDPDTPTTQRTKQVSHNIMYVTQGHALARIDLGPHDEAETGAVPMVALKHMEQGTIAYFEEDSIRVGNISHYDRVFSETRPGNFDFPDVDKMLGLLSDPVRSKRLSVSIDTSILADLAAAMGAEEPSVTLTFDLDRFSEYTAPDAKDRGRWYTGPIKVEHFREQAPQPADGMIMPIRPLGA